jgi:Uma2 family endonuclease
MAPVTIAAEKIDRPPTDAELPDSDGSIVHNFQELFQSLLLTQCIMPYLRQLHPDGRFVVGQDCGIYWRLTNPPLAGCKAPDWFYVAGASPWTEGHVRRSYQLWNEGVAPSIVLEYVSGDGSEERDRTPETGKFWVYERGIRAPYYGIYEVDPGRVEMYGLEKGRYKLLAPNSSGRYPIEPLGLELGIWSGLFGNLDLPWMRWWDAEGQLLPNQDEAVEQERQRTQAAEQRALEARQRTQAAEQRAARLAERLRALGIDPDKE